MPGLKLKPDVHDISKFNERDKKTWVTEEIIKAERIDRRNMQILHLQRATTQQRGRTNVTATKKLQGDE